MNLETGVIVAMVTPLMAGGKVDIGALKDLTLYLKDAGVHGLFVLSSTGEYLFLEEKEKKRAIQCVVDVVDGSFPVMAGASSHYYKEAVRNSMELRDLGADIAVFMPPGGLRYSQDEIQRFFLELADESQIPLMLYNAPHIVNVDLNIETVECLSKHHNIIGLKDTTDNAGRLMELLFKFRECEGFRIYTGNELFSGYASLFGAGMVVALANIAPDLFLRILDAGKKGEVEKVYQLQKEIYRWFELFNVVRGGLKESYSNFFLALKLALQEMGIGEAHVAQLDVEISPEDISRMRSILMALNRG